MFPTRRILAMLYSLKRLLGLIYRCLVIILLLVIAIIIFALITSTKTELSHLAIIQHSQFASINRF